MEKENLKAHTQMTKKKKFKGNWTTNIFFSPHLPSQMDAHILQCQGTNKFNGYKLNLSLSSKFH